MIRIVSWQCCHWDDANVDLAPVVPFLLRWLVSIVVLNLCVILSISSKSAFYGLDICIFL